MKNGQLFLLSFSLMVLSCCANAQTADVLASCGSITIGGGGQHPLTMDANGKACVNATVSASVTGFAPATTGTPISVTTGGNTGSLPAGAVVAAFNTGATNTAFCKLGASATTSDIAIPPASWFAFTVGAATQLTCITSTSTTTVNMVGGSGLPTGAGGGGGGSGGGAITAASSSYAAGAFSAGAGVDGWDLTQGAKADAAWVSGSGSVIALLKAAVTGIQAGTGSTGASVPSTAIYPGLRGQSAEQTAVTNGQLVGAAADLVGKSIFLPYANPENSLNGQVASAMTGTTSTAVTGMGAQAAGVRNYVTACTFSNSHATVGTMVLLQDGSGGTTLWQAPAAPAFGGAVVQFPTPIKTTAATGLFAQNVTTGSNTFVSCTGYKGI